MIYRFLIRHSRHLCLLRPVAIVVIILINVLHPLFHVFEGGSVDMMIQQIDLWAYALVGSNVPLEDS